ncbi:MAG TPA: amidohydrolase family protein [Tepidisphaeraceae bacterium]|jgi:predicted TIM-barrel fold metal-dependent hydrolase|nr:amidohydrolase family protein [Tepidisphaeraceae bacterium]
MIVDCHVHMSVMSQANGLMSDRLSKSLPFRFMGWRLGLDPASPTFDGDLETVLLRQIDGAPELDAAVILAFDAVHDHDGNIDLPNTHLYAKNDFVMNLTSRQPKMLFGASIHPYRRDAVTELERCAAAGCVLLKWLPIVQNFNPADPKCEPFYEALAALKVPLLCHTGGEQSLPNLDKNVADPALLLPALKRGVTVIMAHCGTRSTLRETDYLPTFTRLAKEYEHCYGDTAALSLPTRSYAYRAILNDPQLREKIIHGSDWPILPVPPLMQIGVGKSFRLWRDRNWIRRDMAIKRALGFDDAYWHRAAKVLRLADSKKD